MKLEVKKIGNSAGLILPKELVMRLGLSVGDELVVNETPGGISLTKGEAGSQEELQREIEIGRDLMNRYATTLQALAK